MSAPIQLKFPFKSLDFTHRPVLTVDDICKKLRRSDRHVINLIDSGQITAINTSVCQNKRRYYRIPIESYRDFIIRRMSGPARKEFLQSLPRDTLLKVYHQLKELLAA